MPHFAAFHRLYQSRGPDLMEKGGIEQMLKSALILACILASVVYAQPRCSFETIQGSYATSCQGFMDVQTINPSSPAGTLVPFANLGQLNVDTDGVATLKLTLNVAGTVMTPAISDVKVSSMKIAPEKCSTT
jgi:hypothetical protein